MTEELYKEFMLLSLHGQSKDALEKTRAGAWEYDVIAPYFKCNMTDITAAIGLSQLKRYPEILHRRRSTSERYDEAFTVPDSGFESLRYGPYFQWTSVFDKIAGKDKRSVQSGSF
ncbi:MAG: DegT/DnrJ/EryC1/StrS family aminotransferase [Mediterraneibacter gnavus]